MFYYYYYYLQNSIEVLQSDNNGVWTWHLIFIYKIFMDSKYDTDLSEDTHCKYILLPFTKYILIIRETPPWFSRSTKIDISIFNNSCHINNRYNFCKHKETYPSVSKAGHEWPIKNSYSSRVCVP